MRTLIISLIIIVVYFLGANFLSGILIEGEQSESINKTGMADVEIGVGNKVDFLIKRPRFYGTISETSNLANLKLFNIARIPIKVNGSSWVIYHFLSLILLLIFIKIQLNKEKKTWESNLDGEYSSYSS